MKLHHFLTLILSVILTTSLHAEYFKHIGLTEGLTQPSVMAIYQDQLGRMWFGTREGINLYDGNHITNFKGWIQTKDSALWLGNEVSFIVGDKQGDIFYLIDNNLIKYDIHAEHFTRLSKGGNTSVLTTFEGNIWYMQHDSLFCREAGTDAPVFILKAQIQAPIDCLTIMEDVIYIGTHEGIFIIDRKTHQQTRLLKGIEIYSIFISSQKEVWIGTLIEGLYRIDKDSKQLYKVPYHPNSTDGIRSNQIRNFIEDQEGNIWFGTFDGLHKYHTDTHQYSLLQIPQYVGGLNHSSIFALYQDRQGTIWIGSYFGGVNYFNPLYEGFLHYDHEDNVPGNLYYSYIGDITFDKNGYLWFGTDGGGINCADKHWNILKQYTAGSGNSLPHNNIKSMCYDDKNNYLYIGTHLGGLSRYDISSGTFHNYLTTPSYSSEVPNDVVLHVKMWKDKLYVSARNGVFYLDNATQTFHRFPFPYAYYHHFDIDQEGTIYLAGWGSVIFASIEHPENITHIPLTEGEHQSAPTKVLATSDGVFIATLGDGLLFYNKQTHKISHYTSQNSQLPSDFCYNLCSTKSGKIIITGDKGVSCFIPSKETFSTIEYIRNFPLAHIINECGIYASEDGQIFVGDTKGVTVFSESEFDKANVASHSPNFYFARLWVNNQPVTPGDPTGILAQALPYTKHFKLKHNQNNLIFRFALSDYELQLSEKWFKYKLEGLDSKWIESKQTDLHYTNLDPGTYTLHIAIMDNNSMPDNSKNITLSFTISSPWYNTWWAWTFYVSVFIACIYYYLTSKIAKRTLALSLEKERFEKQQIEQMNQEKLVFFTNVSHEFRTPLTLIISHIDIMLQKYALSPTLCNSILKIRKNAQHMSNLISELLEFRRLEQNREIIQLKQQDLIVFLKEIYLSFTDYAQQREIKYTFLLPDNPVICWFAPQLMEKVFFNLLSNAFKYTPDKGDIRISGSINEKEITIYITDTGIGISEADTTKIFNRFYQGNSQTTQNNLFSGTGIGLALTKTIVEKHHGSITVESIVGKGSTFIVTLPREENIFRNDPNIQLSVQSIDSNLLKTSLPMLEETTEIKETSPMADTENVTNQTHTILLVEDNEELIQVLQELFAPFYKTICAHNGKEGLQLVYENKPDLVISDIMMPEMTGTEMCLQIKNNIDLCHTPIILLTALNSTDQNIEGLNRGADDYIGKPFHAQLLLARVNNLIRNRLLMQHQFEKKPISEIDLTSINPLDKELLKHTTDIIEGHIDDCNFDISLLCKELGVSRSLLFSKFKALTGMTPNNFILNFRLKYAATMLQQYPNIPISEVSDRCGFNTPVYFSRCFKNQYGCTPQNYRKEKSIINDKQEPLPKDNE